MPIGVMSLYYAAVVHKPTGRIEIQSTVGLDKHAAQKKATALLREVKMMRSKEAHKNYKKVLFKRRFCRVRPGLWEESDTEEEVPIH